MGPVVIHKPKQNARDDPFRVAQHLRRAQNVRVINVRVINDAWFEFRLEKGNISRLFVGWTQRERDCRIAEAVFYGFWSSSGSSGQHFLPVRKRPAEGLDSR
jgi:hypothetical protein